MSAVYLFGQLEPTRKLKVLISKEPGIEDEGIDRPAELVNTDVFFAGKGSVLSIMLELLIIAEIPENRYSIDALETAYRNYDGNMTEFNSADLFAEGWLCRALKEWNFSFGSHREIQHDLKNVDSEKDREIILFLRELAKIPYKDNQCLILDPSADSFRRLLSDYGCDIADLERQDIIRKLTQGDEGTLSAAGQKTKSTYCINTIARIWETYGPLVLGRYLEETTKESNDKNTSVSHWLSVISCMHYCWHPEKYLTSMSEAVIDECLDRLEKEDRIWEDEIHCMEKCMAVSYGAISYKDFHLPTERIERRQRLMQLQEYWDSPFSSSFEDRMFGICCRSYKKMNGSQKDRFMTLLMKPHFYIRFFCGAEYNLNCAVDCLKKTELCFEAASLLVYRMLRSDRREWSDALPEFDPVYRKQIGGLLGKILGENLLRERIGSDRIDSLRDILICFSEQAGIYFRDRNMRESAAYGDVFRALFQSLMEDDEVEERLCHDLPASLCWMIQKGRRPLSVCALGVLGDLVNESAFRKRSTKKDRQEAFNGLVLFLKRFLAKEDLLSFCSWDIFLSDHWAEVLQCDVGNEEKLEDVWNRLISEENSAFPEEERWSRTFQHRELAAICLVLEQVICRGDTKKEKKWTGEFFDQHRKLKLFEGETIKDMGFQAVLRYCLAGVSSFSSEGTRRFRDMLSAPDAVDCIFWYPCMNDDQLKKRCHELISGIRFEDLREELLFLPTYVHAGDQLFEILYILKDEVSKRKAEEEDYERIKETLERLLDFLKEIIQKNVNRKKETSYEKSSID